MHLSQRHMNSPFVGCCTPDMRVTGLCASLLPPMESHLHPYVFDAPLRCVGEQKKMSSNRTQTELSRIDRLSSNTMFSNFHPVFSEKMSNCMAERVYAHVAPAVRFYYDFYRASACRVRRDIAILCLSVRLSVTLWYASKRVHTSSKVFPQFRMAITVVFPCYIYYEILTGRRACNFGQYVW